MVAFPTVEAFIKRYCPTTHPLLLALSGGPDSLCLFFCLLTYREKYGLQFHVAHVDHGWREESQEEARLLKELTAQYAVPFHLSTLDPSLLKGNLENACREERYSFFARLAQMHAFQAVLTGHHQGDQAETIFKRMAEGAHWSRWQGLKSESFIHGVRVLRPLLALTKNQILATLEGESTHPFDDKTNKDLYYLRARMRENIFPWLNEAFGKNIENSFIRIGEEAEELIHYFDERLSPLLKGMQIGPWGVYLDLEAALPTSLLEIKYLLRLLCAEQKFILSRQIIEQAAQALYSGAADRMYCMGGRQLRIDRRRLFVTTSLTASHDLEELKLEAGKHQVGAWTVAMEEATYDSTLSNTSWKEGWHGILQGVIPFENYRLDFKPAAGSLKNMGKVKKKWGEARVPSFLYDYFPVIRSDNAICHEFLTGRSQAQLKEGERCWKVVCAYLPP